MRILDLSRPHGSVHPPQPVEGSDRLMAWEQDGAVFDSQGREIVSGETPESTHAQQTPVAAAQQRRLVEQLLAKVDSASHHEIHRTGQLVLGDACPTKRNDILETLRAKLALWRAQGMPA
jgi:hypothetical protein